MRKDNSIVNAGYDTEELYFHKLNKKIVKKYREQSHAGNDNVIDLPIPANQPPLKKKAG